MPFYIKKSVSAGPFRFNFSKGGLGVSVGIKGLRIGTGPRGHYVHAGRGGLYYRATLGTAGRNRASSPERDLPHPDCRFEDSDVTMVEIESGDVMHMHDETFSELLNEINSKASQTKLSTAFGIAGAGIGILAATLFGTIALVLCASAIPAWFIGGWFDSYRRTSVLYYDLEGDAETAYKRLTEGFDGFVACAAKWHIEAGGAVESLAAWKRNAGASRLVKRKATTIAFRLPSVIKSNITPPALYVGKQVMYFMPDIVFVQDGGRVGAVKYDDLKIHWQESRFIETERVPGDAKIVDYTWKHPNKSGGPDRRFKDNREIPICLYEDVHFTSSNGVNELVEFSRTGITKLFSDGCRLLAALPRERLGASVSTSSNLPSATINTAGNIVTPARSKTGNYAVGAIVLGIACAFIFSSMRKPENNPATAPANDAGTFQSPAELPPQQSSSQNTSVETSVVQTADIGTPPQTDTSITVGDVEPLSPTTSHSERRTRTAANLRAGPGTKFAVISVIQMGMEVVILEDQGAWSRVNVGREHTGWIANSTLTKDQHE